MKESIWIILGMIYKVENHFRFLSSPVGHEFSKISLIFELKLGIYSNERSTLFNWIKIEHKLCFNSKTNVIIESRLIQTISVVL